MKGKGGALQCGHYTACLAALGADRLAVSLWHNFNKQ